MSKFTYALVAVLVSIVLISGLVMAAQNKTLIIGEVEDSSGNALSGVSLTIICDGETETYTSDNSGYLVLFNTEDCNVGAEVTIKASKSGYKSAETTVDVDTCVSSSGSLCDSVAVENDTLIFNLAVKSMSLEAEPTPTTTSSRGGGGGSGKKVVAKNNTVVTAPVVATADTADATADGSEVGANGEVIDETTAENAEEESESNGAGITGGVIGAIGDYSFIIALFFIAGILIAYMYVRKRRSSFSRGFY